MIYVCFAFAVIIPYLICSINPAIMVTKIKSGKDIRELGSGNPGLTNTLRTQGKSAALIVLLFDVFKGVGSIFAVIAFLKIVQLDNLGGHVIEYLFIWLAALAAVLGHCFPIYYKFKGGKAVLVTVSALFVIDWRVALILLGLFILIVLATRYVSLGSCISSALCPVAVWILSGGNEIGTFFAAIVALILVLKHKENIKRLVAGEEKKLGQKS